MLARPGAAGAASDDDGNGSGKPLDLGSRTRLALRLQRTIGNAAATRTLRGAPPTPVARPTPTTHQDTSRPLEPALPDETGAVDNADSGATEPASGADHGAPSPAESQSTHSPLDEPVLGGLGLEDLRLDDAFPSTDGLLPDLSAVHEIGAASTGLAAAARDAGGRAGPSAPTPAAGPPLHSAPIQRFTELKAPVGELPFEAPEPFQLDQPAPTGPVQAAAQSAESQVTGAGGQPAGGGGVLDTIVNQAKSWVTNKVSQAAGIVGQVAGRLSGLIGGPLTSAFNFAKQIGSGIVSTIKSAATSVWNVVKGPLTTLQQSVAGVVRKVIHSATQTIKPLTAKIGSMVRGLLDKGGDIVGAIAGMITGAISRLASALAGLPGRITAAISSAIAKVTSAIRSVVAAVTGKLGQMVSRITSTISSVLSRALSAVRGIVSRIEGFLRNIPTLIRSVVQSIVDTVLSTVRRVVETIGKVVADTLKNIGETVMKVIEAFKKKVNEKIDAFTKKAVELVKKFADLVQRGVAKAVGGIQSIIKSVRSTIQSIVKRVLDPIKDVIAKKLAEWIAPKIKEAIKKAGGMKKMLASMPKKVAGAAKGIGEKVADTAVITGHDVLRGLLRPDGDHFSIGISVGVTGEAGVGAGAALTGTADLVLDYASHEIGLFFSPGVTVGAAAGAEAEAGPDVDLTGAWGTVLSFGANRGAGVRQGFQGAFVGGSVNVNAELGARVSRSEGIYVGAAPIYDALQPVGDAAKQGWNAGGGGGTTPPPPPPPGPLPAIPPTPTPPSEVLLTSQKVLFDTGKATLSSAGRGVITSVLDAAAHAHGLHADAKYRLASVGGASLRWRHPGARQNADDLNMALSAQRAQVVASEVNRGLAPRGLGGITQVDQGAMGSFLPHVLGLPADNNSPAFRSTTLTAYEQPGPPPPPPPAPTTGTGGGSGGGGGAGTGGSGGPGPTPGPGGPGSGPNTPSVAPGEWNWGGDDRPGKGIGSAVPNPLHGPWVPDLFHRPTIGWDSGVSLGLREGVGVGGAASVNATFSIPIGAVGFPASAEVPLRVVTGLVKLGLDIATMNVQGGLRDGVGIVGAFVPPAIVDGIAGFVFPLPPGYTD